MFSSNFKKADIVIFNGVLNNNKKNVLNVIRLYIFFYKMK